MAQKNLPTTKHQPISKLSDTLPSDVKRLSRPLRSFKSALKQKIKQELPIAGIVLKNEREIFEQEKQAKIVKNKKTVINPIGDEVVVDPEKSNEVKEAAVLNVQQRTKRAITMRRRMPKIKRAREIARKRLAKSGNIEKRSHRIARKYLKKRLAGAAGKSYSSLPPSSKMAVDRLVSKRQVAIQRLAKRLVPKVKRAEATRLRQGAARPTYGIKGITSSYDPMINQISSSYDKIMEKMKDPCWKGYKMVGQKEKDGKKVPNCVPEAYQRFGPKDPVTRLLGHLKKIEDRKKPLNPPKPVENKEPK